MNQVSKTKPKSLIKHFKTNVLLKSIIGKDLINDDNIAILELVKNSYDAHSKNVVIQFRNLKTNDDTKNAFYSNNTSKIIIQDFGIGMDEDDLENKWLNIAYSEKKTKKIENNRLLAGAKGVGRFSCDRLGEYLDIYTRKKNGSIYHLFVDWKSFEIDNNINLEIQHVDIKLDEIPIGEFKRRTGFEVFEKGTILEISKLRSIWAWNEKGARQKDEVWNTERIIDLKKSLEKLINPNQAFNKIKFSISIIAEDFKDQDKNQPEHKIINGEVKNKIFEKLEYTSTCITSTIDSTGKVITTTITDKGREIFILKEKNTSFPRLKSINIVLYYLNTYSKIYFARQTGIRSVDFGSVYLFINGFRIPPYGDAGDDWLGLEVRKGQGYARFLGTRELIGRIEVLDDSNQFQIVSSREGLVKDKNYQQLTSDKSGYFYFILKRLEKYVVDGLDWDRLLKKVKKHPEHREEEVEESPSLKKIISEFEKRVQAKNWRFSPNDEKYFEDQQTKNKRILSIIDDIIDVKPENIIDLYINSDLIVEIVAHGREKANEEFQSIISELPNLNQDQVEALVEKIKESNFQLEGALGKLDKISKSGIVNSETEKAFKNSIRLLSGTDKDFNKNKALVEKLVSEKLDAERKLKAAEEAKAKAEEEKLKAEEQLQLEREKNTYLRTSSRSLSEDAKGLVHNIKLTSKRITSNVDTLYEKILHGKLNNKDILQRLSIIKFNAEKALKISLLITRSNFRTYQNEQDVDLVQYIIQYVSIYGEMYEKETLEFEVKANNLEFAKRVSVLDVSVILDDLISNSEKAGAKKVLIQISKPSKAVLKVIFSDNGNGVPKKFLEDSEQIFELGVTTTDGSGIGLNSVRSALKSMKGEIKFLGNGIHLKGACFEITFS